MKRKSSRAGGKIQATNTPTWLSDIGRAELEDLPCEETLGGCGHTFRYHVSVNVTLPDGREVTRASCAICSDRHSDWRAQRGRYTNPNMREPHRCTSFVSGVIRHADFEKLFRESLALKESRAKSTRMSADERRILTNSARNLIRKSKQEPNQSEGEND